MQLRRRERRKTYLPERLLARMRRITQIQVLIVVALTMSVNGTNEKIEPDSNHVPLNLQNISETEKE